jgi:hypothetical protein
VADRPSVPVAIARDGKPSPFVARRVRGLVLIAIGLAIGVGLFAALIVLARIRVIGPRVTEWTHHGVTVRETRYGGVWAVPMIVPLFTTLIGAIQLVTGRSLRDLGNAYETMSGGRRFVVSFLVVGLALAVIAVLVAIAFAVLL